MSISASAAEPQAVKPGSFFIVNAATKLAIGAKPEGNLSKLSTSENQESWAQKWALEKSNLGKNGNFTYKLRAKATQTYLNTTGRDLALSLSGDGLSFEFTQYEDGVCRITVPSKPGMVVEMSQDNILQLAPDSTTPEKVSQNQRWTIYRDLKSVIPPGTYYILNKAAGTALDLIHSDTIKQDLTPIAGYALHAGTNQQANGYTIKNVRSGTYLGFRAGLLISNCMSVTGNANPVEFDIHGNPASGYELFLINKKSSMVLDLTGGSPTPGTDLLFYHRSGSSLNQQWWLVPAPDYTKLKPQVGRLFSYCLPNNGFSTKDAKGVYQIGIPEAYGNIRLVNVQTGTSIDLRNGQNGEQVSGWAMEHVSQQKWVLVPSENGYQVKHKDSGRFIVEKDRQLVAGAGPGKEFLFDGNAESGYYMVDALSPGRIVGLEKIKSESSIKLLVADGRGQKWYLQSW